MNKNILDNAARLLFIMAVLYTHPLFASPATEKWLPDSIVGKWEVSEVHVNTEASRTPFYVWNDPRLRWRIFIFESNKVWTDGPENTVCAMPRGRTAHGDVQELIRKSLAGYGYPAKHADAHAYRLDITKDANAKITQIYCGTELWNAGLGADGGMHGSWLFSASPNRILLRWYDETILVLNRISDEKKPEPSFDCAKASSQAEKKICNSFELSSFDRSISDAYGLADSQNRGAGESSAPLIREQRAWLIRRNSCGADEKCILSSMRKRLDELLTPTP